MTTIEHHSRVRRVAVRHWLLRHLTWWQRGRTVALTRCAIGILVHLKSMLLMHGHHLLLHHHVLVLHLLLLQNRHLLRVVVHHLAALAAVTPQVAGSLPGIAVSAGWGMLLLLTW